jgi:hypothetical protein
MGQPVLNRAKEGLHISDETLQRRKAKNNEKVSGICNFGNRARCEDEGP